MKKILLIIFASVGFFASAYLFPSYAKNSNVDFCPVSKDGIVGCDVVRMSEYSHLGNIQNKFLSMPFLGMIFYGGIIIYLILKNFFPKKIKKFEDFLKFDPVFFASIFGFLFSMYLTGIEAFVLHTFCFYCVIQAISATMIFLINLFYFIPFYVFLYKNFIKPILFLFDAEKVHEAFIWIGNFFGKGKLIKFILQDIFVQRNKKLELDLFNRKFLSPVGLSAGFDYNGNLTEILGSISFGFSSVGTTTFSSCQGNEKPRLGRLPKSKSLFVNKGFKNLGIQKVLENIKFSDKNFQIGISIGATNSPSVCDTKAQIDDIVKSFKTLNTHKNAEKFAYFELNISCPNVLGSGNLQKPKDLEDILSKLSKINLKRPLAVKFPNEISWSDARILIKILIKYKVSAVILSNLYKTRDKNFDSQELKKFEGKSGNFSGKPTEKNSNFLIEKTFQEFGNKIKIIGVGGIFSGKDAYQKILLGASAVQMITGMIFGGPAIISNINSELVELLEKDGFKNIAQAVGKIQNSIENRK